MSRDYMAWIASQPCAVCGAQPVHVHHIREGQGMGQRADDMLTIPLCPEHHQGGTGIHGAGRRAFERIHGTSELELLAKTIGRLWKQKA